MNRSVPSRGQHGADNAMAKLSERDVSQIRRAIDAGFSVNALADRFGVHRRTVTRIAAGLTWREPETALFGTIERFIAHTCYPTPDCAECDAIGMALQAV